MAHFVVYNGLWGGYKHLLQYTWLRKHRSSQYQSKTKDAYPPRYASTTDGCRPRAPTPTAAASRCRRPAIFLTRTPASRSPPFLVTPPTSAPPLRAAAGRPRCSPPPLPPASARSRRRRATVNHHHRQPYPPESTRHRRRAGRAGGACVDLWRGCCRAL